jgi:hypothetical protein
MRLPFVWQSVTNTKRSGSGSCGTAPTFFIFCVCLWKNPLRSVALPRGFLLHAKRTAFGPEQGPKNRPKKTTRGY